MANKKNLKFRIIAFFVLAFFLINIFLIAFPSLIARADEEIKTYVNVSLDGKMLAFDTLPFIVGQRTIVPVRPLMEALKSNVKWDENTRIVTITKDSTTIKLKVGESKATVNGKEVLLDTTAYIRYNRVFVPLRFVSQNMNLKVDWQGETKTVVLTSLNSNKDTNPETNIKDDDSKLDDDTSVDDKGDKEDNIFKSVSIKNNQAVFVFKTDDISYSKMFLTSPDRLVIDVKNCINTLVSFNMPENKYIDSFRYSQFTVNPNYVRFVMELKNNIGYNISVSGNTLTLVFSDKSDTVEKNEPEHESSGDSDIKDDSSNNDDDDDEKIFPDKKYSDIKIVIDPGHGGSDPGACGYDDDGEVILKEKDPNLTISTILYEMLSSKGFDVYMTREADTYVSLSGRSDMANNLNADLFISIHNNANDNLNTSGTMVMYAYDEPKANMSLSGKQLATIIQKYLVKALPNTNDYGAVKNSSLSVVRRTIMPAIIVESLFVSNENDRKLLMDDEILKKIATAVYNGILEVVNL